jgi:hypothetical protein
MKKEVAMTNWYVTKNRETDGGDTLIIGGAIKRDGAIKGDEESALTAFLPVHYSIAPAAVGVASVHAAIALPATGTTEVLTAITNPDVPRIVTVKGNAAGITGDVVITGTNIADAVIADVIALNAATEVLGTKAFKTVTSIVVPAKTNVSGDTVSVGIGKKFGMPHVIDNATLMLINNFDGSDDTGSLAVDADLDKNLFSLAGTPNGTKIADFYYLVG